LRKRGRKNGEKNENEKKKKRKKKNPLVQYPKSYIHTYIMVMNFY